MDYSQAAKSLRWLANQFPLIEQPKNNNDRIVSCINIYCENGAVAITDCISRAETAEARLAKAQEELDKMEQLHEDARLKLGKAMDDLRGMCWCCAHARKWDAAPGWSSAVTCKHMSEAGITGGCGRAGKKCDHWEWKGDKHGEFETTDR